MEKEMRLCELELKLLRETVVFNGGLDIKPLIVNNELLAIRVYNKGFIDSTNNERQRVVDEWLYTLIIRDKYIVHTHSDRMYTKYLLENIKGMKVLFDEELIYNNK